MTFSRHVTLDPFVRWMSMRGSAHSSIGAATCPKPCRPWKPSNRTLTLCLCFSFNSKTHVKTQSGKEILSLTAVQTHMFYVFFFFSPRPPSETELPPDGKRHEHVSIPCNADHLTSKHLPEVTTIYLRWKLAAPERVPSGSVNLQGLFHSNDQHTHVFLPSRITVRWFA